jgi:hypothetical protein
MASYKVTDYINARLPNLATDFPTIQVDLLAMGAMAVYWSFFFRGVDPLPAIEDQMMTERQKVICALRACVTILPTMIISWSNNVVVEAHGGPAGTKFADPSKMYKQLGDMMVNELELMESAEGVMLKPGEGIPPAALLPANYPQQFDYAYRDVARDILELGSWRGRL